MAWSASGIFEQFIVTALDRSVLHDLDTDTPKVALYDNDITPDKLASLANTAYNVGQWVSTGNEVSESGQWAAGGVVLAGHDVTTSSGVIKYDANDTASGSAADLANVHGCLVYNDTVTSDYGICFNWFGGANSVVNGTFTVVWAAAGIFTITV
jgi:hypothetical protein